MFAWSAQIISGLDSQSKFHMFTLSSGQHGGSILGFVNLCKYFDKYLKFEKAHRPKTWRGVYLFISYKLTVFQLFFLITWQCMSTLNKIYIYL